MLFAARSPTDATTMASTAHQLQQALESRAIEIQELKSRLQRADADRSKWEAKLPPDVKMLTQQKRELTQQLYREESEKQELFQQINKMISEIAELQSAAATRSGKSASSANELEAAKAELKRATVAHTAEVGRLNAQAADLQRDLEAKSAALQSLRLDKSASQQDVALRAEIARLAAEEKKTRNETERAAQRLNDELDEARRTRDEALDRARREENRHHGALATLATSLGVSMSSDVDALQRHMATLKNGADDEATRRLKLESELNALRQTLASSNEARQEAARCVDELRAENERLRDRATMDVDLEKIVDALRVSKADAASKEIEATEWRTRALRHEEESERAYADLQHTRRSLSNTEKQLHEARANAVRDSAAKDTLRTLERELVETRAAADEQRREAHEARAARDRAVAEFRASAEAADEAKDHAVAAARADAAEELRRVRRDHDAELSRSTTTAGSESAALRERLTASIADAERARGELQNLEAMRANERESASTTIERLQDGERRLNNELREARRAVDEHTATTTSRTSASSEENAKLRRANDELSAAFEKTRREHDDEMCDKERGIAARLETETSRLATTSAERDRTRDEMKKLEATCAELRAQLSRATAAPKTDDELRAENAKLAAQLLSASSTSDDAAQLRDLERKFLKAQATWRRERESLRAELDALRRSNEASQRSAPLVNGASRVPLPKPRKLVAASNGGGGENSSADESPPPASAAKSSAAFANGGENAHMAKMELEKQKRIVTVLRKKLQSQAIDRIHQSRSFMS